jgi:hypothetical protein
MLIKKSITGEEIEKKMVTIREGKPIDLTETTRVAIMDYLLPFQIMVIQNRVITACAI